MDFKKTLLFSSLFILFTIIGAISHEYGHIIVARFLGYKTELHYGSMNYHRNFKRNEVNGIINRNKHQILNDQHFSEEQKLKKLIKKNRRDSLLISIGGPLQTNITGTFCFLILLYRKEKIKINGLKFFDWICVFLSLFWLRQVSNLVLYFIKVLILKRQKHFSGDEYHIALMLKIPSETISIITGILGLLVSLVVIFKIIDHKNRLTFIISGFLGGIVGFIFWMILVGPIILP